MTSEYPHVADIAYLPETPTPGDCVHIEALKGDYMWSWWPATPGEWVWLAMNIMIQPHVITKQMVVDAQFAALEEVPAELLVVPPTACWPPKTVNPKTVADVTARIAYRVKDLREVAKMSRKELGRRAGISGSYVTHIESERRLPTIPVLVAIATALGTDMVALLAEDRFYLSDSAQT